MRVTALCLLSCLAITARAQSCSKPVGGSNMNLKGDDILLDTFPDGSSVSFACNTGYTTAGGSASITCTSGRWSPLRLRCERKNCGAFPDVDYGNVDYPSGETLFGDKAVVTCLLGYILVGRKEISCGSDGWLDRPPVCEVVKCSPPGDIANGYFNPTKEEYRFLEVVTYQCSGDLVLSGSKLLKCSENGKFRPALPKCISVECEDPQVENAEFVEGSRPPHKYMATVTYKCKPDYKMIGASTLVCNMSSKWSPGIPKCTNKDDLKPHDSGRAVVGGLIGGLVDMPSEDNKQCVLEDGVRNSNASTVRKFLIRSFFSPNISLFLLKLALVVLVVVGVVAYRKLSVERSLVVHSTKRSGTDKDAAEDGEDVALS